MMLKLGTVIVDSQLVAVLNFVRKGESLIAVITLHGGREIRGYDVTAEEQAEAGRALVGREVTWPLVEAVPEEDVALGNSPPPADLGGMEELMSDQPATAAHPWGPLQFLLGHWIGEGGEAAVAGTGWFTFAAELQGQILVRTNHAEYPADPDRPAMVHDDLMIIYRAATEAPLTAVYFDSEGHVIHYQVLTGGDSDPIQFLSEASATAPGYRLTYTPSGPDTLTLTFEIAPPGTPSRFSPYITARAHRS